MIPREEAKKEVSRVAKHLAAKNRSVLLFGGLAVNQHVPTRDSVDLDLVCDDELLRGLIADLYPARHWNVEEVNDDGYRPKYIIRSRSKRSYPVIEIGPKITERKPYPHVDWSALSEGSSPFHYKCEIFESVRVPSPSALFFSKIISFVNRSSENPSKLTKDFDDLRMLSETSGFSPAKVIDLIDMSGARQFIQERFQTRCQRLNLSLESVSFLDLGQLLATGTRSQKTPASGIIVSSSLGVTIQSDLFSGFSVPSSDVWQAGVTLIPGLIQSIDYASVVLDSYEVREYRSAAHARIGRGTQGKTYRCLTLWSALSTFMSTDRSVLDDAGEFVRPVAALKACVARCRDLVSNGVQFRYIPVDFQLTNTIAENFVIFDRTAVMLESLGVIIEVSDPKVCAAFVRRFEELWNCALVGDQALSRFATDVEVACQRA